MPRPHVLLVSKPAPFFLELLKAAFVVHQRLHETDPAEFLKAAPLIRGIAGSGESTVTGALIDQLPALEMVAIMGVGYDRVDVAAAIKRGIVVTHTPNVLNDEVADLALGLILAVARRIPQADHYVRSGRWAVEGAMPLARKVSGARLGIVGLGRIGQAIASRALAFGMSVAYTARSAKSDLPFRFFPTALALAAEVDFLVVITPGGAGTFHLIDAQVLKALGPRGYLINVARGSVVDETALVEALQEGAISGAALDVFEDEPRPLKALFELDNVVLTPHMGSATRETRLAMAELAVANLLAHFSGQPPVSAVPECV